MVMCRSRAMLYIARSVELIASYSLIVTGSGRGATCSTYSRHPSLVA
jgi:hypothetical protein